MRLYPLESNFRLVNACVTLLLGLVLSVSAIAKIGLEAYGNLPEMSMVRISPSGDLIAFRSNKNGQDGLVVYSLAKQKVIGGMALTEDVNPYHMYFIDETRLVLKVYRYHTPGGTTRDATSIAFLYDLKEKKLREMLPPGDDIYPSRSGGRIIYYSKDKKHAYILAVPLSNDPKISVMKVKLSNLKIRKTNFRGSRNSIDFLYGPDDKILVHEQLSSKRNRHTIEVKQKKGWKEIYRLDTDVPEIVLVGFTPDYRQLVVKAYSEETDRVSYYNMDIETGEMTESGYSRDDADIEGILTDSNRIIYGVTYSGFNPGYRIFDDEVNQRIQELQAMLEGNSVSLVDWSENFNDLVVKVSGSSYADEYYKVPRKGDFEYLGTARSLVAPEAINPIATFEYTAADGLKIPTLLTIPNTKLDAMKNLPAIMLPHGGPESYDRIGFDWMAQAFASQGYLVIQPQFRGSAGFGWSHIAAGHGEWGKKMQSDLTDGVNALVKNGMVDPERVCIVGASYGGYAALAGGAFTPDLYKCVVSINGVSDLPAMLKTEKYEWGSDHWVIDYWNRSMASGKVTKQTLVEVSPARHADAFKAPVLLLHGELDNVVKIKQSKSMYSTLKKASKEVKFVPLKAENHGLVKNKTRVQALEEMIAFVNKYIGDK